MSWFDFNSITSNINNITTQINEYTQKKLTDRNESDAGLELSNIEIKYDCKSCEILSKKFKTDTQQLNQKIKDLLKDRKEIFTKQEETIKELNKSHLDSTKNLLNQETMKWGIQNNYQKIQIENLNEQLQIYKSSKELVEDQIKNIAKLIEMYESEQDDYSIKIEYKKKLYLLCGVSTSFDCIKEMDLLNCSHRLEIVEKKYQNCKCLLAKIDQCLLECEHQLFDPTNTLQLDKLKQHIVGIIENCSLPSNLLYQLLNDINHIIENNGDFLYFIEQIIYTLLNQTPDRYTLLYDNDKNDGIINPIKIPNKIIQETLSKYKNDYLQQLADSKDFYEKKIEHLEKMCQINQKEIDRASEQTHEGLKNEIIRLKNSMINMETSHMDDLKVMEDRYKTLENDIESRDNELNKLKISFDSEKAELYSKINALKEQMSVINNNRRELTIGLANYQNKYVNQQEINKSLHHALNDIRNESTLQYQLIKEQYETDKNNILNQHKNELDILKNELSQKNQLINYNNELENKIKQLTNECNDLKHELVCYGNKDSLTSNLRFNYDTTIIRILKSTLLTYHHAETHKKHEVYIILCKLLGLSSQDIENINNYSNKRQQQNVTKSFVGSLPIIGRFWSTTSSSDPVEEIGVDTLLSNKNDNVSYKHEYEHKDSFTSLLMAYLEKESNTHTLPKMSESDIDNLVGSINQINHKQSIINSNLDNDSNQKSLTNLSHIIENKLSESNNSNITTE